MDEQKLIAQLKAAARALTVLVGVDRTVRLLTRLADELELS